MVVFNPSTAAPVRSVVRRKREKIFLPGESQSWCDRLFGVGFFAEASAKTEKQAFFPLVGPIKLVKRLPIAAKDGATGLQRPIHKRIVTATFRSSMTHPALFATRSCTISCRDIRATSGCLEKHERASPSAASASG